MIGGSRVNGRRVLLVNGGNGIIGGRPIYLQRADEVGAVTSRDS
jgi:hypothetical protein